MKLPGKLLDSLNKRWKEEREKEEAEEEEKALRKKEARDWYRQKVQDWFECIPTDEYEYSYSELTLRVKIPKSDYTRAEQYRKKIMDGYKIGDLRFDRIRLYEGEDGTFAEFEIDIRKLDRQTRLDLFPEHKKAKEWKKELKSEKDREERSKKLRMKWEEEDRIQAEKEAAMAAREIIISNQGRYLLRVEPTSKLEKHLSRLNFEIICPLPDNQYIIRPKHDNIIKLAEDIVALAKLPWCRFIASAPDFPSRIGETEDE